MSVSTIFKIADNEFLKLTRNPLMIIFTIILASLCIIFSWGYSLDLSNLNQQSYPSLLAMFLSYGIQNTFYEVSFLLATLSMCLGVFALADEQFNGAIRVMLCKPLYRRDIIMGKFIGNCEFLLLIVALSLTILASITLLIYPLPFNSLPEALVRIVTYMIFLFLMCAMTFIITLLIGVLFKNIIVTLIFSVTMVYLQWFNSLFGILNNYLVFLPKYIYILTIADFSTNRNIFDTSLAYDQWLSSSLPYIVLMIVEIALLILITITLFNREEN